MNSGAQPREEPSGDSGARRSHGERHDRARTGPSVPAALVDVGGRVSEPAAATGGGQVFRTMIGRVTQVQEGRR
jgi:hypothetical protein